MNELVEHIEHLPGFKITNSHFRIGSKIHLTNFYYATRFFQNSFFASRLAFMIAKDIRNTHDDKLDEFRRDGLTLIGYELYSELLISLVEKYLRISINIPFKKITHDLISDLEKPQLIKNYETIHHNIIIIVPIASTFTTAIKIEEELRRIKEGLKILQPYFNVLYIAHSPEGELDNADELYEIEKKYGWVKKETENNMVTMEVYYSKKEDYKKNKYLLYLPSIWQDIGNCKICFPDKPVDEKPLFSTDKISVTPNLIFDKPRGRDIITHIGNTEFTLDSDTLLHGHYIRDKKCYRYYIRIEDFFHKNRKSVIKWLAEIKQYIIGKEFYNETDHVLIIAPGHYSNAGFVNLVNEILFSSSANIIHYDPRNDHIENFQAFYKNEVEDEKTKVFFVDDTITSGSTFLLCNYFLKHTRRSGSGFDGCIVLLDRSSHFVHQNVLRKIRNANGEIIYFSYANIHLPSLQYVLDRCPLHEENKRYKEMVDNSFLDRTKVYYLQQQNKLLEKDINKLTGSSKKKNNNRYLMRVEAVHRIYEWFSIDSNEIYDVSFEEWKNRLISEIKINYPSHLENNINDDNGLSDGSKAFFKVLTQPPFIFYKNIRVKVFEWILNYLEKQIYNVGSEIKKNNLSYESFNDLRFLIRRCGWINANYLFSENIFIILDLLFGNNGLSILSAKLENEYYNLIEKNKTEVTSKQLEMITINNNINENIIEEQYEKIKNVREFNVFFTAQIKELLYLNEERSIKIEERIIDILNQPRLSLAYKQLLRIIREENGLLIQKFWFFIRNYIKSDWSTTEKSESFVRDIENIFEMENITKHYRYQTLDKYFKASYQLSPKDNHVFIKYLLLMKYLEDDVHDDENLKKLSLNDKTEFIIEILKEIIFTDDENAGSLFIVKYKTEKENPYFVAYNKGKSGPINSDVWDVKDLDYLKNFLEGKIKDDTGLSNKTIIEFHLEDGKYIDLYSANDKQEDIPLSPHLLPKEYNRLLIIRISKLGLENEEIKSEGQAIIGFYFNKNDKSITDVNKTRYLLLLRLPISKFIKQHHENEEFRDWKDIDDKQRTTLLAGHGREMLMNVAKMHGTKYTNIIQTILLVQRFILDLKEEENFRIQDGKYNEVKSVNRVFKGLLKLSANKINSIFLNELKELAEAIFRFDEIENQENCEVYINPETYDRLEKANFSYPIDILIMICFELLVNAKKNRWIFLKGEKYSDGKIEYEKNLIEIDASLHNSNLFLSITNTGPSIEYEGTKEKLNSGESIKEYKSVAGIELIRKLLTEFKLGTIEFDYKPIKDKFSKFIVNLTLYNWNE